MGRSIKLAGGETEELNKEKLLNFSEEKNI